MTAGRWMHDVSTALRLKQPRTCKVAGSDRQETGSMTKL